MSSRRPSSVFLLILHHSAFILFSPLLAHAAAPSTQPHLLYRGINPIPLPTSATDQHGTQFQISGLSGITHATGNIYYAVCDNSNKLLRFEITFNPDCSIKSAKLASALSLSDKHDYEGAAFLNDNIILLSEEDTPGIHAVDLGTGETLYDLPIPKIFAHPNIVRNQGFESLTFSPDKANLFSATERATISDGNTQLMAEPFSATTRIRIQRFTVNPEHLDRPQTFSPASQSLYQTSGVHAFAGQIGLCDLVALNDTQLIALERSAAETLDRKPSIRTRIYLIDTSSAPDVSQVPSLKDQSPKPLPKTLLYDGFIFDEDGENLEGLCLGPEISPGRKILLGCVDNTDGIHVSQSRLVAFELLLDSSSTRPAR
jgi:hypothetical protein